MVATTLEKHLAATANAIRAAFRVDELPKTLIVLGSG